MTGTYSVRAVSAISRRGEGHVRRRGGIAFGESEVLVSTDPNEPGAELVTEEQLDAILHDSNLRDPESKDPTTPGLRAKEVVAQVPSAPQDDDSGEGEEETAVSAPKSRKRKA